MEIMAHGGDQLSAPLNTMTAYWAALACGADGIIIDVQMTSDHKIICSFSDSTEQACGVDKDIRKTPLDELLKLDAGLGFHSLALDDDNQSTGQKGQDTPWASQKGYDRLSIPTLHECLQWLSRRTKLTISLPDSVDKLFYKMLMSELTALGCENLCQLSLPADFILQQAGLTPTQSIIRVTTIQEIKQAVSSNFNRLLINYESLSDDVVSELEKLQDKVQLCISSEQYPYGLNKDGFDRVSEMSNVESIAFKAVSPSRNLRDGNAVILEDNFKGKNIDRSKWSAGYSHQNQDTVISQDDKIIITIKDDGTYSGAGVVSMLSFHGDFETEVDFYVKSPQQGTTFEMAAISQDPGYFHIDNSDLSSRKVNLTFDVHGAPPYASSECDEDDGFRCGWNNGFNLTKISEDYAASSVNMYNKYGRDVGPKATPNTTGTIRMIRHDAYFTTFYKDKTNQSWVCSGTMLVNNMSNSCHIRLAAKHWQKQRRNNKRYAPGNEVHFMNFSARQWNILK